MVTKKFTERVVEIYCKNRRNIMNDKGINYSDDESS
jgi:hypothetical protein